MKQISKLLMICRLFFIWVNEEIRTS